MIDDGWYSFRDKDMLNPRADLNLPQLCAYAREKGVSIILWAVGHTLIKDADRICGHYAKMGVAGFKVDFFEAQEQDIVKTLYDLAEVTARHRLILDIHGCYKPTGLNRTWPNVVNFEGVYGLEQMKWTDKDRADMPLNDVLIPYIRMACGPMDYTPGAMINASKRDYRSIDHMAMSQGTRAHQLALYIVYDSPLTMLCDTPSNYLREDECTRFISSIPTVFDRSKVLGGKVGLSIVMGRQKDGVWYVGGLTSWESSDFTLDCSFLEEGSWTAEIIKDGANSDRHGFDYKREVLEMTPESSLQLHMAPGGGFAIIFRRK
jgi:alpha-glucosidase